jgi:glycosyltransferase involved in cell wall biosynthesis
MTYAPVPWEGVREWRGSKWAPLTAVDWKRPGIWLIYRQPSALDNFPDNHPDQRLYLVSQDVTYPDWTKERMTKLDRFMALCQTHAQDHRTRWPGFDEKIFVSANGIKRDLIEQIEKEGIKRNPRKMIYASSPDRGLVCLLKVFKRAQEWVKNLELHVFYGFDNIDKLIASNQNNKDYAKLKAEVTKLCQMPGVIWRGRINQPDLIREWFSAGIWCHPSVFTETGCITSMEAQACGAIPITTPIWAVAENVKHGMFIQGNPYIDPIVQARFVSAIYRLVADEKLQADIRAEMIPEARFRFDWEKVVDGLEREFHSHIGVISPKPIVKNAPNRFILYSPISLSQWDWNNTESGIGGCETSVAEMAWRLQRAGSEVIVYAPVPFDGEREWRGTKWRPVDKADFSIPGTWCIYRVPQMLHKFDRNRDDQVIWLMMQDWDYDWKGFDRMDRVVTLCHTHEKWLLERHPELKPKLHVTSNGIKVDLIEEIERTNELPPRNPRKMIYASSPDRGLKRLLEIFAKAQAQQDPAQPLELHVFYGFDGLEQLVARNPDSAPLLKDREEIQKLAGTIPGVHLRGRVSQTELYREWFSAGIWCYPTDFAEMSCITCQEAQAMGAIPVTCEAWAQGENTLFGITITGDPAIPGVQDEFVKQLVSIANDIPRQERIRAEMMPAIRQRFDWNRHVSQWEDWTEEDRVVHETQICRGCGEDKLETVLDLGEQAIAGYFPEPGEKVLLAPLELVRCTACDLGQLRHSVDRRALFAGAYGYRSGINETMRGHLKGIAKEFKVKSGDLVVDIGCNDGTFLENFPVRSRVGYDPSEICPSKYHRDFFSQEHFEKHHPGKKAKVVTSLAMFYDLEDPLEFAKQVHGILADDGIWVIEVQDFAETAKKSAFDTICHEHLTYWDATRLEEVLVRSGFVSVKVDYNSINGGSMRVHAMKVVVRESGPKPYPLMPIIWKQFAADAHWARASLKKTLEELNGKQIWGYGASTKGNVLLQFCGITNKEIVAIADRNPEKWGKVTPGSNIPIVSETLMRQAKPDYLLALPWAFMEEFRKREPWARWIVPFPEAHILGAAESDAVEVPVCS